MNAPVTPRSKVEVFVPAVGAYDNIGDIVLRRQLLRWLAPLGNLHVYLGRSPNDYDEGLRIPDQSRTYKSFASFSRAALTQPAGRSLVYAFKPGEIQMTLVGTKEHLGVLPILLGIRARGGVVIRVGSGARSFSTLPKVAFQPSLLLSDLIYWRDVETTAYIGRGKVMPDLAFGEGGFDVGDSQVGSSCDGADRDLITITMRGDRSFPTPAWLTAVRETAKSAGKILLVTSQVKQDDTRCDDLARALGAESRPWGATSHLRQEMEVRELYRRSSAVVSDRLHALIMGVTEGAVPVAPLTERSQKIDRHFRSVGLRNVSLDASEKSARDIGLLLATSLQRSDVVATLARARTELDAVRAEVHDLVERGRAGLSSTKRPSGRGAE